MKLQILEHLDKLKKEKIIDHLRKHYLNQEVCHFSSRVLIDDISLYNDDITFWYTRISLADPDCKDDTNTIANEVKRRYGNMHYRFIPKDSIAYEVSKDYDTSINEAMTYNEIPEKRNEAVLIFRKKYIGWEQDGIKIVDIQPFRRDEMVFLIEQTSVVFQLHIFFDLLESLGRLAPFKIAYDTVGPGYQRGDNQYALKESLTEKEKTNKIIQHMTTKYVGQIVGGVKIASFETGFDMKEWTPIIAMCVKRTTELYNSQEVEDFIQSLTRRYGTTVRFRVVGFSKR